MATVDEQEDVMRRRYPNLSVEELQEVKEALQGYFEIALRIHERLQQERREDIDRSPLSS